MSDYAAFLRWQLGCRDRGGYGASHGDTFYCGLRDYNQPYPCPNGLPIDRRTPDEVPAWRERLAKARREIDIHSRECAARKLAGELTAEDTDLFISEVRAWATSLQKVAQVIG